MPQVFLTKPFQQLLFFQYKLKNKNHIQIPLKNTTKIKYPLTHFTHTHFPIPFSSTPHQPKTYPPKTLVNCAKRRINRNGHLIAVCACPCPTWWKPLSAPFSVRKTSSIRITCVQNARTENGYGNLFQFLATFPVSVDGDDVKSGGKWVLLERKGLSIS